MEIVERDVAVSRIDGEDEVGEEDKGSSDAVDEFERVRAVVMEL